MKSSETTEQKQIKKVITDLIIIDGFMCRYIGNTTFLTCVWMKSILFEKLLNMPPYITSKHLTVRLSDND